MRNSLYFVTPCLLVVVLLFTGCEAEVVKVPPRVRNASLPGAPASTSSAAATFEPATIAVKVGDETELAAMIAAHKGKVVFVDYWATWCEPCVEFFPHTVETHDKYQGQGLTTIAVSFDAASEEEKVRRFLAKERVGFENLICSYDPGTEAFEKFGIDLVPHFRLYDKQGKLRAKWDAAPKDLDAKVKELLAEK
ncbi:TlpA family protein disulfide reductase [Anatilimnocola floriformis]|uniref:TlpA family protein disulfide reductase n=1 Tax=Anatilimnocola floriformis TaxID=2948575 RepID=UPI0020C58485|nr:TlpA disulfide reductase family protein [Anatilimnocola floriformis]